MIDTDYLDPAHDASDRGGGSGLLPAAPSSSGDPATPAPDRAATTGLAATKLEPEQGDVDYGARDWLIRQLEAWPERVNPERTTNIKFLMTAAATALRSCGGSGRSYQARVADWMSACFGADITNDAAERNFRFLEEALELVQACGTTREEAHRLVDYTFDRPIGEPRQEVGGVMVCLAALCIAHGFDMADCGEVELTRIWSKIDQIRAKHASKPKDVRSPLPGATLTDPTSGSDTPSSSEGERA